MAEGKGGDVPRNYSLKSAVENALVARGLVGKEQSLFKEGNVSSLNADPSKDRGARRELGSPDSLSVTRAEENLGVKNEKTLSLDPPGPIAKEKTPEITENEILPIGGGSGMVPIDAARWDSDEDMERLITEQLRQADGKSRDIVIDHLSSDERQLVASALKKVGVDEGLQVLVTPSGFSIFRVPGKPENEGQPGRSLTAEGIQKLMKGGPPSEIDDIEDYRDTTSKPEEPVALVPKEGGVDEQKDEKPVEVSSPDLDFDKPLPVAGAGDVDADRTDEEAYEGSEQQKRDFERDLLEALNRRGEKEHTAEEVIAAFKEISDPEDWVHDLQDESLAKLPEDQLAGMFVAGAIANGFIRIDNGELLVSLGSEVRGAATNYLRENNEPLVDGKRGPELVAEIDRVVAEQNTGDTQPMEAESPPEDPEAAVVRAMLEEIRYNGQPLTAQQVFTTLDEQTRGDLGNDNSPESIAGLYSGYILAGALPLSEEFLIALEPDISDEIIATVRAGGRDPDGNLIPGQPMRAARAGQRLTELRRQRGLLPDNAPEEVWIPDTGDIDPNDEPVHAAPAAHDGGDTAPGDHHHGDGGHDAHGDNTPKKDYFLDVGGKRLGYVAPKNWLDKIFTRVFDGKQIPSELSAKERERVEGVIENIIRHDDPEEVIKWLYKEKVSPEDFAWNIAPLIKEKNSKFGVKVVNRLRREVNTSPFVDDEKEAWLSSYKHSAKMKEIFRPVTVSRSAGPVTVERAAEPQPVVQLADEDVEVDPGPQPIPEELAAIKREFIENIRQDLARIPRGIFNREAADRVAERGSDLATIDLEPEEVEGLKAVMDEAFDRDEEAVGDDQNEGRKEAENDPKVIMGNAMLGRFREPMNANNDEELRDLIKTTRLLGLDKKIGKVGEFVEGLSKILEIR